MKRASVTYTKNNLSRLLGMVREGARVLVVDRDVPVATIEPVAQADLEAGDRIRALVRKGIVSAPVRRMDLKRRQPLHAVTLRAGVSAVKALLEDREESR